MSAPDDPAPPLVRLRRPAELAAAAPYLMGFHPAESVLVATLRRPCRSIGLVVRTDLPPPEAESARAEVIARYLGGGECDGAVVLVHTEDADTPADCPADGRVRRRLVTELRRALAEFDIPIREALLIRGGRWVSYLCSDRACCPVEGSPVDAEVGQLAAIHAWSGRVVMNSRADLVRSIERTRGAPSAAVEAAVDRALSRFRRSVEAGASGGARGAEVVREELDVRQAAWGGISARAGPPLEPDRLADLVVALTHPGTRDVALARCVGPHGEAFEPLWLELVRRAPPPLDAAPATLLAVSVYVRGNGVFSGVCLERALSSHPGYSLAELMQTALERAVPPARVVAAIRSGVGPVRRP